MRGFRPRSGAAWLALLRAEAKARDRAGLESSVIAPRPYVAVFGFVPQ